MSRSVLNLSNTKLLTGDMGNLLPISLIDCVPGDHFRHSTSMLIRTQPLFAPVMHNCTATIHHFFVPERILADESEIFHTGGLDGLADPIYPTIISPALTGYDVGSLADYLGVPPGVPDLEVSAYPFRAYAKVFNEYYLDQQLQTELVVSTAMGADTTTSVDLQNGAWGKDYFTESRPEPQLGTEVTIPLIGSAPITGLGAATQAYGTNQTSFETDATGSTTYADGNGGDTLAYEEDPDNPGFPNIRANLDQVAAVDLNQLRLAAAVQRFKEKMNRGGARYVEYLQSVWSQMTQDSRLQRPEYIGGGRATIQFSEVLSTAETTGQPVGSLLGHGIAAGKSNRYSFKCPEHGYIISLLCVRPKTMYTQGLHKLWNRRTKFDYLVPDLANLGDQEIQNQELYAEHSDPKGTFGFIPRFDEYRTIPNTIAGEFRTTLNFWHLGREFTSDPALNSDFVTSNPTDRIYATTTANQLQIQCLNNIKVKRKLPKVSKPSLF